MKKLLSLVLALAMAICLTSCSSSQRATLELIEDADTLCYTFLWVVYVDDNGFAGMGMPGCEDDVFVVFPGADKKYDIYRTVQVEFYGRDIIDEDRTVTTVLYNCDGSRCPIEHTCSQTVTHAEKVRLSDVPPKDYLTTSQSS